MRHSTEPTDQILVKGYRFLSFAKNIGKKSRNLSTKYSQKRLDHGKQSVTDATGNLIGNKIANKITKA